PGGLPQAARAGQVLLPPAARAAERARRHQQHQPDVLLAGAEGRVLHAQGPVPGQAGQARRGQPRLRHRHPVRAGVAQGLGRLGPLQRRALLRRPRRRPRRRRRRQRRQLLPAGRRPGQARARAALPGAHAVAAGHGRRRRQRARRLRRVQGRHAHVVLDRLRAAAAGRPRRAARAPGPPAAAAHRQAVPAGAVLRAAHRARGGARRRVTWRALGRRRRRRLRRADAQAQDRAPAAGAVDGGHDRPRGAPPQAQPRGGHLPSGARAAGRRAAAAARRRHGCAKGRLAPGRRRRGQHVPRGAGPAAGRHQDALRTRLWRAARHGPGYVRGAHAPLAAHAAPRHRDAPPARAAAAAVRAAAGGVRAAQVRGRRGARPVPAPDRRARRLCAHRALRAGAGRRAARRRRGARAGRARVRRRCDALRRAALLAAPRAPGGALGAA
ncbi:hypothetical protein GGI05_006759, partial [Coemansia sp. RSA 2603]